MRSAPSTPRGWKRTSRRPVWRCCGRCSRAPTPARTLTRARSSRPTGPEKPFRVASVVNPMAEPADLDLPWTRTRPASRLREFLVCGVLGPLMDLYTRRRVAGRERLDDLTGPVVFVANHNSHMDTPVILRALPGRWRRRTAVAAAVDYFYDKRRNALSTSLAFGTVPIDRNSGAGSAPARPATSTASSATAAACSSSPKA